MAMVSNTSSPSFCINQKDTFDWFFFCVCLNEAWWICSFENKTKTKIRCYDNDKTW